VAKSTPEWGPGVDTVSVLGIMIFIVIGGLVAVLAYRESEAFRKKNGVTPWGMPSWAWALIGFASLLVGAILLAVARRTTDPVVPSGPSR
jgi:hypothetical protein